LKSDFDLWLGAQIAETGPFTIFVVLVRIADDSASEDAAVRVAQTLYDDPNVAAVVGHLTSGASIAAAPVYGAGAHPVVMISPSASSPELGGVSSYVFRICPTDVSYGAALARFALKWRHRLPCDVRRLPERLRDWLGGRRKV